MLIEAFSVQSAYHTAHSYPVQIHLQISPQSDVCMCEQSCVNMHIHAGVCVCVCVYVVFMLPGCGTADEMRLLKGGVWLARVQSAAASVRGGCSQRSAPLRAPGKHAGRTQPWWPGVNTEGLHPPPPPLYPALASSSPPPYWGFRYSHETEEGIRQVERAQQSKAGVSHRFCFTMLLFLWFPESLSWNFCLLDIIVTDH